MSDSKVHWSFWTIAVLALFWNGMGAMNFISQMGPNAIDQFPEKYQDIIRTRPVWGTWAFGIGAVTSVLGSVSLLFRRGIAKPLFIIAFLAVLVTLLPAAPVQLVSGEFSTGEIILTVVMPILVSIFLVWYSNRAKDRGVLT